MISCADAVRRLWEYVELTPSTTETKFLEEHLALCRKCCGEAAFAEELRSFLALHTTAELPVDAEARLNLLIEELADGDG